MKALHEQQDNLPVHARSALHALAAQLRALTGEIDRLEEKILARHRANETSDGSAQYRLSVRSPRPQYQRGGKARDALIVSNWLDLFRCAATMSAGQVAPSRIMRKLAACPGQNDLTAALREVGRIERTLFIIE